MNSLSFSRASYKFLVMLLLWASTKFVAVSTAALVDPQNSPILRNLMTDDSQFNFNPSSVEVLQSPDHDNHITFTPLSKNKLDELQLQRMLNWRDATEMMKRWLNHHYLKPSSNTININGNGKLGDPMLDLNNDYHNLQSQNPANKRNGGSYMCHFKLCQLGAASNGGKRRWNPSSYD